ncbi:MAG: hypothetical protein M1818_008311 [Claussenomyces sp. TS43310]|nr:MAG: hypothetical protein M1818_008311 [Claussenomyces sp. TS43310]
MSRNVKHARDATYVPKRPSKNSSKDRDEASYDSDYSGVDLISDSDEEEPDVEEAEEQAIIDSEEDEDIAETPQPADDDQSSWGGFDLDVNTRAIDGPFFDAQLPSDDVFVDASAWEAARVSEDEDMGRRVRFDLSSTDSSDIDETIFPDIFLEQNSLDPGFRRTIENDHNNDNDDPFSDEGSYWDFQGDEGEEGLAAEVASEESEDGDDSIGSSGYETDEGETTEEDLPAAAKYVPARSVLRRQSDESSDSEEDITVIRHNPYSRGGPKLGSWVTDASKPFAVIDSHGKKLVVFKAKIPRRHSFSTPTRPAPGFIGENDGVEEMSPMISNSANLMMSAMYTPLDGTLGGQALGPPEAFYPFVSVSANGVIARESASSSFDEDDVDDDEVWNIQDLIDFGDDSDEAEEDDSNETETPSTPARPLSSEDQVHPLLEHFGRGVVGAFRRNQNRHHLISRNVASRESLAFSGPYQPVRGIKGGRLAAANTPITPLRKSKTLRVVATPSSPVAPAEKKRKYSGEQHSHKRSKSMV